MLHFTILQVANWNGKRFLVVLSIKLNFLIKTLQNIFYAIFSLSWGSVPRYQNDIKRYQTISKESAGQLLE